MRMQTAAGRVVLTTNLRASDCNSYNYLASRLDYWYFRKWIDLKNQHRGNIALFSDSSVWKPITDCEVRWVKHSEHIKCLHSNNTQTNSEQRYPWVFRETSFNTTCLQWLKCVELYIHSTTHLHDVVLKTQGQLLLHWQYWTLSLFPCIIRWSVTVEWLALLFRT